MKKIITILALAVSLLNTIGAQAHSTTAISATALGTDSAIVTFQKNVHDTLNVHLLFRTDTAGGISGTVLYGVMDSTTGIFTSHCYLPAGTWYLSVVAYDSATHLTDSSYYLLVLDPISTASILITNTDGFTTSTITHPGGGTVTETHIWSADSLFTFTYMYKVRTISGISPVTSLDTLEGLGVNDTGYNRVILHSVGGYFPDDTVTTKFVTGVPITLPYVAIYGYPSSTDTSIDFSVVCNVWGSPSSHAELFFRSTPGGAYTDSIPYPVASIVGAQIVPMHFHCPLSSHWYYFDVRATDTAGNSWMGTTAYETQVAATVHSLTDSTLSYDTAATTATLLQSYSNISGNSSNITVAHWYAGGIVYTVPYLGVSGVGTQSTSFAVSPMDTGMHAFFGWSNDLTTGLTVHSDTMWLHIYAAPTYTFGADSLTKALGTKDTVRWATTSAAHVWIGTTPVATSGYVAITMHRDTTVYFKMQGLDGSVTLDSVSMHADSSALDTTTVVTLVQNMNNANTIRIYPNPTTTDYIVIEGTSNENYNCTVSDLTGRQVDTFAFSGKVKHTLNISSGEYFLTISNDTFKETQKIFVQTK